MNLIDEYLRAVGILLPRAQREDIIAELRDNILSRIEARQEELGRALTESETEAVLRVIGHPLVVAARYREGPQHVVGPTLYPYWLFAVKIACVIQLFIAVIVLFAHTVASGNFNQALGQAIGAGVNGVLVLVGVATATAWLIERQKISIDYFDRWRVRDLRVLDFAAWDWDWRGPRPAAASVPAPPPPGASRADRWASRQKWRRHRRRASRTAEALWAIVWAIVFVLWWVGAIHFPIIGSEDDLRRLGVDVGGLANFDWSGLHRTLLWPVLGYEAVIVLQAIFMLISPWSASLRGAFDIAIGVALLALANWLWTTSPLAAFMEAHSFTGLLVWVETAFRHGPPLPLAPMIAIAIAGGALGGLFKVLGGLWLVIAPPTWTQYAETEDAVAA